MNNLKVEFVAGDFRLDAQIYASTSGQADIVEMSNQTTKLDGEVERLEVLAQGQVKHLLASAAWGIVGFVGLGLIGAAAGVLKGGNKSQVYFACYLKDGRKFMAVADARSYQKLALLAQ